MPKENDLRVIITGSESRSRRKKYKWVVQRYEDYWGEGSPHWRTLWDTYDCFRRCEGYARTARFAERAARICMVDFQLTAPSDPCLPEPLTINVNNKKGK